MRSDTPRTDAITQIAYGVAENEEIDYHALLGQMTEHARQLERELKAARRIINDSARDVAIAGWADVHKYTPQRDSDYCALCGGTRAAHSTESGSGLQRGRDQAEAHREPEANK